MDCNFPPGTRRCVSCEAKDLACFRGRRPEDEALDNQIDESSPQLVSTIPIGFDEIDFDSEGAILQMPTSQEESNAEHPPVGDSMDWANFSWKGESVVPPGGAELPPLLWISDCLGPPCYGTADNSGLSDKNPVMIVTNNACSRQAASNSRSTASSILSMVPIRSISCTRWLSLLKPVLSEVYSEYYVSALCLLDSVKNYVQKQP